MSEQTTMEQNQKNRIEYLESLLLQIYESLQSGMPLYQNSQAHREIGICLGKIDPIDPASTVWGTCKPNILKASHKKLIKICNKTLADTKAMIQIGKELQKNGHTLSDMTIHQALVVEAEQALAEAEEIEK